MEGLPGTAPAHSEKSAQETASGGWGHPPGRDVGGDWPACDGALIPGPSPPTPLGAGLRALGALPRAQQREGRGRQEAR